MQKWYSTLFHLSPPNRRNFLFTERSLEFQKSQIGAHLHLSLSRCSVFPPPAVRRRWTSSTACPRPNGPRGVSQRHLAAPWHLLARTRVSDPFPSRHDTPGRRSAAAAPPARRRAPLTQIDRPQSLHSSPRSSLAYKDPQNPTDAPLLPLLPPSAAPPWPPRSRSRGPASPAPHCPLRPPQ